jgi:type IV secretory pathway VirB10-like protein
VTEHEEEVWAAADAAAAPPEADAADAGRGASPPRVRGYDKRLVYGIAAAVLAVFIAFSFLDGPSGGPGDQAEAPPPAAESGPLVADPPYAAVRREPPLARPDTVSGTLVPPPSSSVIGGADGRPYAAVASGGREPGAEDAPRQSPSADGTAPGTGAAATEDPRLAAWRAVRDAAPTSGWSRTGGDGAVASFEEPAQEEWTPELARPAEDAEVPGGAPGEEDVPASDAGSSAEEEGGPVAAVRGPTFVVPALTRIEAALVTAVNSDVPGDVVAQVSRDVPDASGRHIAIPAGSLLHGKQTDQVAVGQRRLVVAWSMLQLPDGTMVPLPGLPAADQTGASGLPGEVSSRSAGAFGRALLLSAIGAGFQLSQPQSGDGATPSAGRAAAAAVGQKLAELSAELLRRDVGSRPTIRVRQGSYLTVMVARDLAVPVRRWARTDRRPAR